MRTDSNENSSSIIDMESGRILTLNHENRTYVEVSFDSLLAMTQALTSGTGQAAAGGGAQPPENAASDVDYSFNVSVDQTGESERIAGYEAERVFMTVEMEARGTPEGETQEQGSRMVMFTDMWMSTDLPGYQAMRVDGSHARRDKRGSGRHIRLPGVNGLVGGGLSGSQGSRPRSAEATDGRR